MMNSTQIVQNCIIDIDKMRLKRNRNIWNEKQQQKKLKELPFGHDSYASTNFVMYQLICNETD